jgi:hypothetical protein
LTVCRWRARERQRINTENAEGTEFTEKRKENRKGNRKDSTGKWRVE